MAGVARTLVRLADRAGDAAGLPAPVTFGVGDAVQGVTRGQAGDGAGPFDVGQIRGNVRVVANHQSLVVLPGRVLEPIVSADLGQQPLQALQVGLLSLQERAIGCRARLQYQINFLGLVTHAGEQMLQHLLPGLVHHQAGARLQGALVQFTGQAKLGAVVAV